MRGLLGVICDCASRGGAGEEAWHRWGQENEGVRRGWTHPVSLGTTESSLPHLLSHLLLCLIGILTASIVGLAVQVARV